LDILITGATRGIGAALAQHATARGDTAIGTSRGGEWPLDLSDPQSPKALAKILAGRTIDTLVCNAGIYPDRGQTLDGGFPAAMWAEGFAVNVTGTFLTIQALLPNLMQSAAPRIAIISSQMASDTRASGGSYIYRASKAAVLNLGRNLAQDLKPRGVAVGIYHPGWVRTDMGGSSAEIDVTEAATGLLARFDALSLATTGCFETWDGRAHPF